MSSAAVVRDVFATTASFKRCTVLHNTFPVCTTVYVFQANSTRTLTLVPSRPLQNTSTHHAVSSWLLDPGRYVVYIKAYYNGRIWKWTSKDLFCTEDRSRIAPGGPPFLHLIIVEMFGGNVALSTQLGAKTPSEEPTTERRPEHSMPAPQWPKLRESQRQREK